MKTLYIDCSMGCAGDMLTAALLELHPDPAAFLAGMNAALGGRAVVSAAPDAKCGIRGTHVTVTIHGQQEGADLPNAEHTHGGTSAAEIMAFLDTVPLSRPVRENAKAVYARLLDAESAVHGCAVEQVHFHEVGALDALADVLCVCALMDALQPQRVLCSPINVGSGQVRCAHGVLPVPAPATERLLRGVPVYAGSVTGELCTPTGAALLRQFVSDYGAMPQMCVSAAGYGTGKKNFAAANVVRVLLGESGNGDEQVVELCCNIDDQPAESLAFAMDELLALGALDVYFTAVGMKKGRPGVLLTCLCRPEQRDAMLRCIFRNTTTLGVRERTCARYSLARRTQTVQARCVSKRRRATASRARRRNMTIWRSAHARAGSRLTRSAPPSRRRCVIAARSIYPKRNAFLQTHIRAVSARRGCAFCPAGHFTCACLSVKVYIFCAPPIF